MAECFSAYGEAATGTNVTIWNLFSSAATPSMRPRIYAMNLGATAATADAQLKLHLARTTAVGTEGSGFTPNNLDSAGPAGQVDMGVGTFSAEPTYTASKQLLTFPMHQRTSYPWEAIAEWAELVLPATQNAGAGLRSVAVSTGTPVFGSTVFFKE